MDLLAYLRILRRRWILIVAVALAGVALGAGSALATSSDSGPSKGYFKATHVLFLDTTSSDQTALFANLDQAALLVTSGDVPLQVGKKLGQDGRQLAEHILTTPNSGTNTLEITAAASTAHESEQLANTFADQLVAGITKRAADRFAASRDRVLKRLDSLQSQIDTLNSQILSSAGNQVITAERNGLLDEYRITFQQFQNLADQADPISPFSTLEAAQAVPISAAEYDERLRRGQLGENIVQISTGNGSGSGDPSGTTSTKTFTGPVSRGLLGGILGLLGGVGLALVAERLDRRLRSRLEVEEAFGLPVLAEVPVLTHAQQRDAEVLSLTSPLSRTAEAHRAVRSALIFHHGGEQAIGPAGNGEEPVPDEPGAIRWSAGEAKEPLVVLVTSSTSREGKTTTTANLAAVFAETGSSVLAVNCDFRRPTLHLFLGAPDEPRKVLQTTIPGVTLVSGVIDNATANPALVIAEQRHVIEAAKERFDVVLLDTAPMLTTNDAIEIMPAVDAVVMVSRADVTTADNALRARELLERVRAPVVGVVLVADDSTPADSYYYYSSRRVGKHPERRKEEEEEAEPTDASLVNAGDEAEGGEEIFATDDETTSPSSA